MKTLINFSIRRRFLNKTSIIVYGSIFILIGLLFFSDKLVRLLAPSFYEINTISITGINPEEFLLGFEEDFKIDDNSKLKLEYHNGEYIITSNYPLSTTEKMYMQSMISIYEERNKEPYQLTFNYLEDMKINEDSYYFIITTIYFMVLSFATMASNEVVVEKTTHILETIGSIVGIKVHFQTKMILGWLMLWIQILYLMGCGLFFIFIRMIYDQGEGLFDLGYRFNLLTERYKSFSEFLDSISISFQDVTQLLMSLIFLLVGVGLIQVFMVSIASKISSSEEASALYTPIQLIFMFIYYLSIFLNNPEQMNYGWGYYLSFVPVFSMLLMPLRILTYNVNVLETITSLCISGSFFILLNHFGYKYYEKHIFEYNTKSTVKKRNV